MARSRRRRFHPRSARHSDALEGIPARGRLRLRGHDFVAITRTLSIGGEGTTAPVVAILRPQTEQAAFLRSLQAPLVGAGLLAVFLATLLSYGVARTVTRPVGTITETMREMTATGDLTKRISLSDHGPWTDDDALTLAGTFNTLTDSIARFQQEAAQRERLSALGRLSTVIAHEIRNPLMIIKAALRDLTRSETSAPDRRQAAHDIDEEVDRLNRVVSDVLDFARPVTFETGPVSLNRLCTDAVAAVSTAPDAPPVATRLDPAAEPDCHRRRAAPPDDRQRPDQRQPRRRSAAAGDRGRTARRSSFRPRAWATTA